MTLRPTDMLRIQSAIDEYEKKYPRRPAPTAEQALTWRLGKRAAAQILKEDEAAETEPVKHRPVFEERAPRKIRLGWFIVRMPRMAPALSEDTTPALKGVVRLGWWGMLAVGTVSIFALGAFVGGFK